MKYLQLIVTCIAFCFLTGCSSSYSYHKSPILVSAKATSIPPYKVLGQTESKGCTTIYNYMMFFPIVLPADFKKMYSKVMEDAIGIGGDAVIDFQVRLTSTKNIFFLYISECYSAIGTTVKFTDGNASAWDITPEAIEEHKPKSVWD